MGFDKALMVCQLFSNCPKFLMLSSMALLCSSVTRQGGRGTFDESIPGRRVRQSH